MALILSYNSVLPVLVGATSFDAGMAGIVPAPGHGQTNYFLQGNGQWSLGSYTAMNILQFTTAGNFVYTPSNNMVYVMIECIGAGGAGGAVTAGGVGSFGAASGGGGGQYAKSIFTAAQIGSNQLITVGQGASPRNASGGNTYVGKIDSILIAAEGGGSASSVAANTSCATNSGGAGGGYDDEISTGEILINGQAGRSGIAISAASVVAGIGGRVAFNNLSYGAGGSGATYSYSTNASASQLGKNGIDGACIITEYILSVD